ncbi:MAG: geranyl transferase, partial [Oscillospiraceae bacterium]|nr:geranyl transferase [Oscillospiraceae bacterium]
KPIGSDREEGKTTSVDLFGLEGCREKIRESSRAAESALAGLKDAEFLLHLVRVSEERSE